MTWRVRISCELDVAAARQAAAAAARALSFCEPDVTRVSIAASEVAQNICTHAGEGEVEVCLVEQHGRRGVQIVAVDRGPGIVDPELAMQDGYSTAGGLGLGLPGAKRLMDEFALTSSAATGTRVVLRKWSAGETRR